MNDVIVYLWVDVWEMDYCLDPEFWEHEPGCPPLHVSLKNPTEDENGLSPLTDEDKLGEGRNFILLKRKIYLLPSCLILQNSEIHYECEKCSLKWSPVENTVVAKNQYGTFSLMPAD